MSENEKDDDIFSEKEKQVEIDPNPLATALDELNDLLEKEKQNAYMQIVEILKRYKKYNLSSNAKEEFLKIAKEIVKNGKFLFNNANEEMLDVIDLFCEKEILFFDPKTGIITPNSRIYLKAIEELR